MRVFVTGATGFVGGYVLTALTREQHEVVVLMRRPAALEQLRTRVYRRAGAYEASKLEGALKVGSLAARDGLDYVEVQSGTVAGHSLSGELAAGQSLRGLIDNLVAGRLARVPGMPRHWLPLISVDALAEVIATAATAERAPRVLLALDRRTPSLAGLMAGFSDVLACRAPSGYLPLPLLAGLLKIPGMPQLMRTAPESLHFIQTARFDTSVLEGFVRSQNLPWPDMQDVIRRTAEYWLRTPPSCA